MQIRKLIKSDGTEVLQYEHREFIKPELSKYHNTHCITGDLTPIITTTWRDIPVVKEEKKKVIKEVIAYVKVRKGVITNWYNTNEELLDDSHPSFPPFIKVKLTGTYEVEE